MLGCLDMGRWRAHLSHKPIKTLMKNILPEKHWHFKLPKSYVQPAVLACQLVTHCPGNRQFKVMGNSAHQRPGREKCDHVSANLTGRVQSCFIPAAHCWPERKLRKMMYRLLLLEVSHAGGCLIDINELKELEEAPNFQQLGQWVQQEPRNPQTPASAACFLA